MLVAALPEIWFLKDTNNDGKADLKIRMLQGVCSADSHHSANAMLMGPDGWLYCLAVFSTSRPWKRLPKRFAQAAAGSPL